MTYCLALCDEMFDHFPQLYLTKLYERHMRHQSHTAKSAITCLTVSSLHYMCTTYIVYTVQYTVQ